MDDLGGKPTIFGNTHVYIYIYINTFSLLRHEAVEDFSDEKESMLSSFDKKLDDALVAPPSGRNPIRTLPEIGMFYLWKAIDHDKLSLGPYKSHICEICPRGVDSYEHMPVAQWGDSSQSQMNKSTQELSSLKGIACDKTQLLLDSFRCLWPKLCKLTWQAMRDMQHWSVLLDSEIHSWSLAPTCWIPSWKH